MTTRVDETITFERTLLELNEALGNMQIMREARLQARVVPAAGFVWTEDVVLTTALDRLKQGVDTLNDSATKLSLICTKFPEQIPSILEEVYNYLNLVVNLYFEFCEVKTCQALFDLVSQSFREFLTHISSLLTILCNANERKNTATVNNCLGLVWKSSKELQSLPASNKIAYRRDWMKSVGELQETVKEFEGYAEKSQVNNSNSNNSKGEENKDENEDEDNDDFGFGEFGEEYDGEELLLLRRLIQLVQWQVEALKHGLQLFTAVGNHCHRHHRTAATTVESSLAGLSLNNNITHQAAFDSWMAGLVRMRDAVTATTTDLGCEMYAPLDTEALEAALLPTKTAANQLLTSMLQLPLPTTTTTTTTMSEGEENEWKELIRSNQETVTRLRNNISSFQLFL